MASYWKKSPPSASWLTLQQGFSFAEAHAGTNAVALALLWHEPVWTMPSQNYHTSLSRYAVFAIPPSDAFPLSIAVISMTRHRPDWPLALLRQMERCIVLEKQRLSCQQTTEHTPFALTNRQKMVLLCIARGLTDRAVAVELCIGLDTVRFHKKNLYRLLDADNAVTAVVQALKIRLLTLDEI